MNERHDEFRDLCALYALGSLGETDRARFEAHLQTGCIACAAELAECIEGTIALAHTVATPPDPKLRARVLAAIGMEARESARLEAVTTPEPSATAATDEPGIPAAGRWARTTAPRPDWAPRRTRLPDEPKRRFLRIPLVASLGWAAAIAAAILGVVEQKAVQQLERETASLRESQRQLESQLFEERRWAATMASPAARTALFTPTGAQGGDLSGWARYDASTQRAIIVLENLRLEPGHDFELWAIGPHGPRSLGVIQVESGGRAFVRLTRVVIPADLAAFAVSYEAKGGSPNPTAPAGPVVLVGNL